MGGRGRARTQRKHFRQSRENVWKRPKPDPSSENPDGTKATDNPTWTPFATQNPAFDEYYSEQGIVPSEEWDAFIGLLRTPLPAAFRINSCSQFSADIRSQLENDFVQSLRAEDAQGDEAEAIRPLPWYPENLAWHSNFSRMQLRKNQTLERFHEFLKLENEIGNITRQEAVSMVPPLFLNVHPNHFVLDMCAAPGSKTFQLLEIIHQSTKAGALPDGMVIANDLDVQRCNLLIHQTKRMCTANLIVTNHEAQQFPGCRLIRNHETLEPDQHIGQLLFDCILCDVPCSGDGTLRKAPDLWRKWNTGMGNGLHSLQVLIAMRGVSLLKVGGRMVYSTCSMNPIENEAVVAEILRRCGGSVELADVSSELPQLIRRPGLKRWKVRDRGLWLASYKDVPMFRKSAVLPSMFPSGKSYQSLVDSNHKVDMVDDIDNGVNGNSEGGVQTMENPMTHEFTEEVFDLPLERCMRIVPHDQNTGAFFIAVLQKVSPLPAITVQEKPKKGIDKQRVEPENQDIEDSKVLQVNSSESTHEEVLEEVNIIDNKPNTADLEVNPSVTCIERDSQEAQEPLKTESIADEAQEPLSTESIADEPQEPLSTESIADEAQESLSTENIAEEAQEPLNTESIPEEAQEPLNTESIPEEAQEPLNTESIAKITPGKRKLQIQGKWRGVDPVVFFKDEIIINSIKAFYGIHERFPFSGHLVTRNNDTSHVKRIYYVSKSVKDVLELNFSVGQQLKITSIGLKMFERQTSREGTTAPCAFRISSEGLPLILPYITKQILRASLVDFKHLLQYKAIKFTDFVDAEFGKKAAILMPGYCVVVLGKEDKAASQSFQVDESTIAIGCWKGRAGLSVMVTAMDCRELLERLLIRPDTEKGYCMYEDKPSNDVGDKVPGTNGIAGVEATGSESS